MIEIVQDACHWVLGRLSQSSVHFPLTCHGHFSQDINEEFESAMSTIIRGVADCTIGLEVSKIVSSLDTNEIKRLSEDVFILPKLRGCSLLMLQDSVMKITFLLSSWIMISGPIKNESKPMSPNPTCGELLQQMSAQVIFTQLNLQSQMELFQLSNKLAKMRGCHEKVCCSEWDSRTTCI